MKIIFLTLLFSFFPTLLCFGQDNTLPYRHALSFSFGGATRNHVENRFVKNDGLNHTAPYDMRLGYFYRVDNRLSIGLDISVEGSNMKVDHEGFYDHSGEEFLDEFISIMPSCRFTWREWKKVRLYSKGALGTEVHHAEKIRWWPAHDRKDKWGLSYQLSPLGIEYGRKSVLFFMEFGYGNEGIFQAGISFRFGKVRMAK